MKVIRIQKAPKGKEAKYVALTEKGQLICGYRKLADIRKEYAVEIKLGQVELRRELDRTYN